MILIIKQILGHTTIDIDIGDSYNNDDVESSGLYNNNNNNNNNNKNFISPVA
jgi:hypothetical protein